MDFERENLDRETLLRRLAAAEERAERERERAERERERAERERERADRYEAERAPTSLERYLELVHDFLISTLSVENDLANGSSGGMTNVDGKWYPRELHRWDDFGNEHHRIYNMFLEELSNKQLFPSHTQVAAIGSTLSDNPQEVELDVRPYVHGAIESPVRQVVETYLRQTGNMDKLFFRNTGHSLDQKDNVSAEDERSHPRNKSSDRNSTSARRIPDRWCIRESADGGTVGPIFLGEYKPARKLRAEAIAQVLASPPSDLFFQVLRRKKFGRVDPKGTNEEIVAKALCQTFDYMIRSGLLYGYLSSGDMLILLKIEESAAWKLFFHYTPVTSVGDFEARRSPIAQMATLAMLALRSGRKPAQWISDAEKCLIKWPYTPSDHIPSDELRRLREHGGDPSDESGGPDDPADVEYVPPPSVRRQSTQSGSSHTEGGQRRRSPRKRSAPQEDLAYCTQACLLGLVRGQSLDLGCPNTARHRRGTATTKHLLTQEDVSRLTRKQLARNLDEGCICLDQWGMFGATGVLFKLTVTGYGYTFVAKGVQSVDESLLEHESRVYARLAPLQGTRIPVYLGIITLQQPYPLVSLARVTQMLLMSWAGEGLGAKSWPESVDISAERQKTLQALASSGVRHDDVRDANLVWNPERQLVMAIDFDRTTILSTRKRKASPLHRAYSSQRVEREGREHDDG